MNIRRRGFLVAASVAASALLSAAMSAHADDPIRIGWLPALTGPLAASSIAEDYGARIAVDEINAAGGVLGRNLMLVTRDTGSDTAKAVSFAKELIYNERVDLLLGPANSGEALPVVPAAAAAKLPNIVMGSLKELIDPVKYPYAFRTTVTNDQWIKAAVEYAVTSLGTKKLAILTDTSGYGTVSKAALVEALAARGIEPTYVALIDANRPDVTGELNKARDSGAELLIVWSASTGLNARILNARGDTGWDVPVVGQPTLGYGATGDLLSTPDNWKNAFHTGFRNSTRNPDGSVPELTAKFLETNESTIQSVLPNGLPVILLGYSAVHILAKAVEDAGSTDPDALKAALEAFSGVALPYANFRYTPEIHNGFPDDGVVMNVSNSLSGGLYDQAAE